MHCAYSARARAGPLPSPPAPPPSPPAPPPGPPPPPYALVYRGCYTYVAGAFPVLRTPYPSTVEACYQEASQSSYPVFALMYGSYCYLGDDVTLAMSGGTSTSCTAACLSNAAQTCGGTQEVSLYQVPGGFADCQTRHRHQWPARAYFLPLQGPLHNV